MFPTLAYRSTILKGRLSVIKSQDSLKISLRIATGRELTACWSLNSMRVAHRNQTVFYSINGEDLGECNGSGQPSGNLSSNGSDAQGASDLNIESTVAGGGGGSNGYGNGGSGGGGEGNGNGDGRENDEHNTTYTFFPGVLSQVLQVRILVLVVLLVIYKWANSRQMQLKRHEAATEASTAAGVDGGGISESHELAKQLFDDFMFEADASPGNGPAAGYSSAMQIHQHSPGPLKRLRHWLASLFTRGGDVAELKATVLKLR